MTFDRFIRKYSKIWLLEEREKNQEKIIAQREIIKQQQTKIKNLEKSFNTLHKTLTRLKLKYGERVD